MTSKNKFYGVKLGNTEIGLKTMLVEDIKMTVKDSSKKLNKIITGKEQR